MHWPAVLCEVHLKTTPSEAGSIAPLSWSIIRNGESQADYTSRVKSFILKFSKLEFPGFKSKGHQAFYAASALSYVSAGVKSPCWICMMPADLHFYLYVMQSGENKDYYICSQLRRRQRCWWRLLVSKLCTGLRQNCTTVLGTDSTDIRRHQTMSRHP